MERSTETYDCVSSNSVSVCGAIISQTCRIFCEHILDQSSLHLYEEVDSYLYGARLSHEIENHVSELLRIVSSKSLHRLGHVICSGWIVAAKHEDEPSKHRKVFLL